MFSYSSNVTTFLYRRDSDFWEFLWIFILWNVRHVLGVLPTFGKCVLEMFVKKIRTVFWKRFTWRLSIVRWFMDVPLSYSGMSTKLPSINKDTPNNKSAPASHSLVFRNKFIKVCFLWCEAYKKKLWKIVQGAQCVKMWTWIMNLNLNKKKKIIWAFRGFFLI